MPEFRNKGCGTSPPRSSAGVQAATTLLELTEEMAKNK